MRLSGTALVAATLAFALAAGTADAAGKRQSRSGSAASPQDSMADQLNAQSLQSARSGRDAPTPGPDSTSNLNRMSEQDAAKGQTMPRPPMPFR
jgi:hypothetical protein